MEISLRAVLEQPRQLLTAAVAAVAAALIGSELYALLDTALSSDTSAPARTQTAASSDPVAAIIQAGLFGATTTPVDTVSDDTGLPQSSAQMVLRGVFTGAAPDQGSAIFELPDGSTRMVRAGGNLNGVVLERIYAGRVVLNRNGLQENLSVPSVEEYANALSESSSETPVNSAPADAAPTDLSEDEKRTNILRRLEELRARSLERNQG